jgi:WD40 repeat protein
MKKTILIFGVVFLFVLLLMFLKSHTSEVQLDGLRAGVDRLYTVDNQLVLFGKEKDVKVYDWGRLKEKYSATFQDINPLLITLDEKLIYNKKGDRNTVFVKKTGSQHEQVLATNIHGEHLQQAKITRNGKLVYFLYVPSQENPDKYNIKIYPVQEDMRVRDDLVFFFDKDGPENINNLILDESGQVAAVFGTKDGKGWISLVGIQKNKVLWTQVVDEIEEFVQAVFANKEKWLYAAGVGRNLVKLDSATGHVLKTIKIDDEPIPAQKRYVVTQMDISPNGRYLVLGTEPLGRIYLCQLEQNDKMGFLGAGHRVMSGLSFSPDSQYLASSGVFATEKVRIWKLD